MPPFLQARGFAHNKARGIHEKRTKSVNKTANDVLSLFREFQETQQRMYSAPASQKQELHTHLLALSGRIKHLDGKLRWMCRAIINLKLDNPEPAAAGGGQPPGVASTQKGAAYDSRRWSEYSEQSETDLFGDETLSMDG